LPRSTKPSPKASFYGLTLWLLDSLPSAASRHRQVSAEQVRRRRCGASAQSAFVRPTARVRPLTTTTRLVLRAFHRLTIPTGKATITYVPAHGARSQPLVVLPGRTYLALVGPLPLEIEPVEQPARLCSG
jgi:hypothetical protein